MQPSTAMIQDRIHQLAELFTEDMLNKLHEAASDNEEWKNGVYNPTQFFEKHGIELPEGFELRLLDIGNDLSVSYTQDICPQGLRPVLNQEWNYVCTKAIWVVNKYGEKIWVCIEKGWVSTSKWYCYLPIQ